MTENKYLAVAIWPDSGSPSGPVAVTRTMSAWEAFTTVMGWLADFGTRIEAKALGVIQVTNRAKEGSRGRLTMVQVAPTGAPPEVTLRELMSEARWVGDVDESGVRVVKNSYGWLGLANEETEPRYDGTSLEPCSDRDCIMLSPAERRGRVGTNGGCAHLKQRGPDANQLIRKLAREVVRLRESLATDSRPNEENDQ